MIRRNLYLSPDVVDPAGGADATIATATPATQNASHSGIPKPVAPRKATAGELAVKFDISPTDEVVGDVVSGDTLPVIKPEVVAPKVETAPVAKPEPKPETIEQQVARAEDGKFISPPKKVAAVAPIVEPIKPLETSRDYTSFTPEETAILKQMSNPAFEYVSKLRTENKQLAAAKDVQYLQHPKAHILSPDYQKIQEDGWYAAQEGKYWQNQLALIKQGKQWQPITGWTNGRPDVGPAKDPTDIHEEEVRLNMNNAFQAAQGTQQRLQQFEQGYQQNIQRVNGQINAVQAERFAWVADSKLLDSKVNVGGDIGEVPIKQIRADFLNLLPIELRSGITADLAANMFVGLQIYAQQIRELQAATKIAEVKKDEVIRGEPKSSASPPQKGGKAINGVKTFDLEGLPQ